jgi:hypothetical protein
VAGDVDWATFTVGPTGASNVRIQTAGASGDTELWLYGPDSPTLPVAYDDESGGGGFSLIAVNGLVAGKYYVKVAEFGNNSAINSYTLRASWSDGLPPAPSGGRLVNLSIRTSAGSGAQTVVVGFVLSGAGTKQVLLRGVGPTLGSLGVAGVLADPTMQLFSGTNVLAANDNWGTSAGVREAATTVGAFALPTGSLDAALLQTLGVGAYTLQIGGGSGVTLVEAYEVPSTAPVRLSNVSARTQVGLGDDALIAGFVIAGNGARNVLIRAIGPGLSQFGVNDVLADPKLDLYRGSAVIQTNDNWGGTAALTAAFGQVGAFALPTNSRDAVLQTSLQPGAYSVQISGVGGTTGVAMVEVYELP